MNIFPHRFQTLSSADAGNALAEATLLPVPSPTAAKRWLPTLFLYASVTTSIFAQGFSGPVHLPPPGSTNAPAAVSPSVPATLPDPAPAATQPSIQPTTASAPSSPTETAGDIRDIRGPISIPYQWLWAAYVLTGIVVAALAFVLWRWLSGRAKERARLPHELALDKLEAARSLMTEGTVREYAFAVSEVIRFYIEQRFGERAAHRTTEEFLTDLMHTSGTQLAGDRALLEDFLHHCDLPKFARWQLSVREMESMHESARAFILKTQPQAQATPPPSVPAQPEPATV